MINLEFVLEMKRIVFTYFIAFFALLFNACSNVSTPHKEIPLENFFKSADKSNMMLSPNGDYISYVALYKNRPNVFLQLIGKEDVKMLTSDTIIGISKYAWVNDSIIIFLKDIDGKSNYHLYKLNIHNNFSVDLTPFESVKIQIPATKIFNQSEIFIMMNKRDPNVMDLYKLNVLNNEIELIEKNNGNIGSWLADLNGNVRLAIETDGVNEKILFKTINSKNYKVVISLNFKESLIPLTFTEDGNSIYALSNINRDKVALVVFDLINAKEKAVIYEHKDVEISDVQFSELNHKPLYAGYHTSKYQVQSLSDPIDIILSKMKSKLKEESFSILNWTKDESKYLIKSYSDKSLGEYYIYDFKENEINKISSAADWLDKRDLADVQPFKFLSRDNLEINGYITYPKTKGQQFPLIVLVGYNPWDRIKWQYNSEVQFLANRGYAVLQINQRGSDGYGKKFHQAGFKELGMKMQDDISDGVKYIINQGNIDSNKVGIMGYGFGGYAALNACVKDSNMYKCAISNSGYLNLFSYMKTIPPYYNQYLKMIYEMLGNPEKDYEYFKQVSPIFNADKINSAIFISQGGNDTRISTEEVSSFVKSLQKHNNNVKYLYMNDEGHGFRKLENRYTLYKEIEEFLDKNLKNTNEY